MKKLICCITVWVALAGMVSADDCDQKCTYELIEIDLTYAFKRELIQSGQDDLVAGFADHFLSRDIPIHLKRIEFNLMVGGRDFEIVEGSLADDYFVWVKIKTCE